MSSDITQDGRQQRVKEFMQILPLTVEIAGLPMGDPNRIMSSDQMEVRASVLKNAYKIARQMLKDLGDS